MRFLRENTATRVTVGPFIDVTDGITPEVALTVTSCHLTLVVDDSGVPTLALDANATASGGNNDMVHITNDDAGFYDLELTATNLNYTGRAILSINDVATHLPVFHEFMILPSEVYDSLVLGSDFLQVDVIQIEGTDATTQINNEVVDVLRTDTIPDSYSTDGSQPTFAQAVLEIRQFLMEKAVSGTTVTVYKPDGTTSVMTFTLNDADSPTTITRAS